MTRKLKLPPRVDPELAAEMYDDGESMAGAAIAAELAGMELSEYLTRNAPRLPPKRRTARLDSPPAEGATE